jgi:hypothetical protein
MMKMLLQDPATLTPMQRLKEKAVHGQSSTLPLFTATVALGGGAFLFTANPVIGIGVGMVPFWMLLSNAKKSTDIQVFDRISGGCFAHLLSESELVELVREIGKEAVAHQLCEAIRHQQQLTPAAQQLAEMIVEHKPAMTFQEMFAEIDRQPLSQDEVISVNATTVAPTTIAGNVPATVIAQVTEALNGFVDTLLANPFLCRAIIAGQRTGKTYGAAVATWCLKDGDPRMKVYYINLQDHGQGNAAAFAHATRVAIGNLARLGNTEAAVHLVADAIEIVREFYADPDDMAILVVDEWMATGTATRKTKGLETLWHELADKSTALTSNGLGSSKAIWGITPFMKAGPLRKDALCLKLFEPTVLSISPGQSIPWTNPKNNRVTHITMSTTVLSDVATNWQGCGIAAPTEDQEIQWKRSNCVRVFWANGEWRSVGPLPALPTTAVKSEPPLAPLSKSIVQETIEVEAQTVAESSVAVMEREADPEFDSFVEWLTAQHGAGKAHITPTVVGNSYWAKKNGCRTQAKIQEMISKAIAAAILHPDGPEAFTIAL